MSAAASLAAAVKHREPAAIARALTMVENELPDSEALLALLDGESTSKVIAITGLPGSGKSTLINALLRELRRRNKTAGVLAIDPSSTKSRGALLGDRVRFDDDWDSRDVFVRSLALRGGRGGIAAALFDTLNVLKAATFDYVLLETVGVGQAETAIADLADCVVLLLVPGTGDELQLLKGGIMEIPDLLALNKSDLAGADLLAAQLAGYAQKPVVQISASKETGVATLLDHCDSINRRGGAPIDPAFMLRFKVLQRLERILAQRYPAGSVEPGQFRALAAKLVEDFTDKLHSSSPSDPA